jgi:hypothetical protein
MIYYVQGIMKGSCMHHLLTEDTIMFLKCVLKDIFIFSWLPDLGQVWYSGQSTGKPNSDMGANVLNNLVMTNDKDFGLSQIIKNNNHLICNLTFVYQNKFV